VRITGDRAVHTEEMSLVIGEAILAGAASLVVVTLLLWVCLASLPLLAVTLLTLIVGLAWTAGLAALAVGHLNAVTSAFAVLYIGLGVDYGIHFALGYLEQRGLGRAPEQALRDTGSRVGSSLLFCALTTATGFYAFIPTAYRAVGDMGIICGTGVFLGLAATLVLYPALIALGIGEPRHAAPRRLPLRLPSFPLRWPRLVCTVTAAVTAASFASLAWIRFDLNTLNVRDPRVESVQALKDLLLESERSPWTIEVLAQDLEEARELAARLEALDGVKEVHTIESFVPEDQAARLAVLARMRSDLTEPIELGEEETGETLDRLEALKYTIEGFGVALDIDAELGGGADDGPLGRASERLRAALLDLLGRLGDGVSARDLDALEEDVFGELPDLLQDVLDALPRRAVSLADLPGDLAGRYLAPDGRARVVVFSSANLNEPGALERFSDLVRGLRPDAGGPAAGTVALGRAIVDSLRQALVTAVVVITLLLMILWRSLRATLLTLTPLAVGALTTAAASVVLDVPLNFANIIVLPLILGIGVDSGIHLVHRHRLGLLGSGNLLETSTARAVLFSALTTVGSFATLGLSNHLGIASLGRLLTIGVVLMLVANVVVLPAVLTLLDRRRGQPAPPATRALI
jgi:hopanoid biosynthesis associated RND transporter like protein HpnN